MDKNTRKILKFYNSHPNDMYSPSIILQFFPNIPPRDILDICQHLCDNSYLRHTQNNLYQSTNKGKSYNSVMYKNWISEHLIETIALIFSIASFGISVFSIIYSILTRQSLV